MTEIPSGSVIITPDDMWKTIQDTAESSRRTEAAVNELKLLVNPALFEVRKDVDTLDKRVTELEKQSWSSRWVPALVTSVLVAGIGGVVIYILTHLPTP